MAYSPEAVANAFLEIAERAGVAISPMKIQKLVYFAHGWHLAINGTPLINAPIHAWRYGPVIESLYGQFRDFGNDAITRRAVGVRGLPDGNIELYEPTISPTDYDRSKLVQRIWEVYGDYTAIQLSNMTHEPRTPWHQVTTRYPLSSRVRVTIPDDLIREYFARLAA